MKFRASTIALFANRTFRMLTCLVVACVIGAGFIALVHASQAQGQDAQAEVRLLRARLRNKRVEANAKRRAKPQSVPTAERPDLVLQTGHGQRIDALAFAPDGRYFASGSPDSTIKIWDALNGRELRAFAADTAVRCIAFSPDGGTLASGGGDGQLRLWDVATGKAIAALPGHASRIESLSFSRDGRWLATAGADAVVIVWDFAGRKILHRLGGFKDWAQAVAFSNDGRWLAAGGRDRTVKLWNAASGEEDTAFVRAVNAVGNQAGQAGQADGIKCLAFTPDSAALVVGSQSGSLKVWRLARGELLAPVRPLGGAVIALAFSADGHTLTVAAQDRTIKQFDAGTYREQLSDVLRGDPEQYEATAFSPDAQWLVSCNGGLSLELRRVAAGGELRPLASTANAALAVAFSPDGLWLATGNNDATATLWDLVAGRAVARLPVISGGACAVAFDGNSETLAAGSRGGEIKIWDVTGTEKGVWKAHQESINALVFTADGRLISASADRTIKIWNAASGALLATLAGHSSDVHGLSLSPDGQQLASASSDQTIKLWNLKTTSAARTLTGHQAGLLAVAFSPDGRALASAGDDQTIKVWDVASGMVARTLAGFGNWVNCVAFTHRRDGQRLLAAGDGNGLIKVWDANSWQEKFTLSEHTGQVRGLAFDPDDFWLVSSSEDGVTRVWETAEGHAAAAMIVLRSGDQKNNAAQEWLAATPDGLFDGSPMAWNQIIWRFGGNTFNAFPVEVFFNDFYYPDLLGDLFAGKAPRAKENVVLRDRRQPEVKFLQAETTAGDNRWANVRLQVSEAAPDQAHKTGSGARDVRLFRNGVLVKPWRGDVLPTGKSATTLEYRVKLAAGENRLTAYAFNRENIKSRDALSLVNTTQTPSAGTLYLLAFGVNRYSNPEYNLNYAEDDARSFAEEVGGRQRRLNRFARTEVITLFNEDATKANLQAALRRLAGDQSTNPGAPVPAALEALGPAQPEDAVIFYFAGHGVALGEDLAAYGAPPGERFYLIPYDIGYKGKRLPESDAELRALVSAVTTHGLSDEEMEVLVAEVDAGQIAFVLDACQSGQLLETDDDRRGPLNSRGLAQLAYDKGMNILAASQSYQAAVESSRLKHGYLTFALVEEGLKNFAADQRPRDRQVWLREWLDYATERVPILHEEVIKQRLLVRKTASGNQAAARELQFDEAQRPRVFYRREADRQPLVIAK